MAALLGSRKAEKEMTKGKLNTEKNTPAMGKRITTAAQVHFKQRKGVQADFEHGQWWISLLDGSQYSVVDAEGPGTTDGFDFEMVTEPQE